MFYIFFVFKKFVLFVLFVFKKIISSCSIFSSCSK